MMITDALRAACQALVDAGLRLLAAGLVQDGQGNLSLRLPDGRILITPSAVPYRERSVEDICLLSPQGEFLQGRWKPTSELPLHLAFYRRRADVMAVVHTHAPYATTFGVTGEAELPMLLTEAAMHLGGAVPVAPYARPGTEELAQRVCERAGEGHAVILAHHGLVTVGPTLTKAYHATLAVEDTARAWLLVRAAGFTPYTLPADEARALYAAYQQHYHPASADQT